MHGVAYVEGTLAFEALQSEWVTRGLEGGSLTNDIVIAPSSMPNPLLFQSLT
jgi:hypothetical protein